MRNVLWHDRVANMRERLSEPLLWFPFPALIAFGLIIVLRAHIFSGFNHRLGTEANVLELDAEPLRSPGIWMAVTQDNEKILIVTDDHQRFTFPLASPDLETLRPLIKYLNARAHQIAFKSTLDLQVDEDRIRAVLAVDQKLKFIHIRPLLYALAEAKISSYGFETRMDSAGVHGARSGTQSKEHL